MLHRERCFRRLVWQSTSPRFIVWSLVYTSCKNKYSISEVDHHRIPPTLTANHRVEVVAMNGKGFITRSACLNLSENGYNCLVGLQQGMRAENLKLRLNSTYGGCYHVGATMFGYLGVRLRCRADLPSRESCGSPDSCLQSPLSEDTRQEGSPRYH